MKILKVSLWGRFKKGDPVWGGKRVFIDRLKGNPASKNYISARVVNLWKRPQWFDIGWFDLEED